ncbi:hypothetical protein N657DRAFT_680483 [Parathielavia appendiculata]|uniref:Uncharacterized protein n=1 Tax=Parathielavia appendiculata TaxID=2587402 RepID=A0AAN6Z536_9PEZI|nr:hypothetical protein N657DRAFT_680483 [Parathielavia appendiculata]
MSSLGARLATPVAATNIGFQNSRVYYVTPDNQLGEAAYDSGTGWYNGNLTSRKFDVAPYFRSQPSSSAASSASVSMANSVTTRSRSGSMAAGSGWTMGSNLGPALPRMRITATTWRKDPYPLRYAFQDGQGWQTGSLRFPTRIPRVALGVTSWGDNGSNRGIRHYCGAPGKSSRKRPGTAAAGTAAPSSSACIPASNVAALPLDVLRVFLQNGTNHIFVTEYVWADDWTRGHPALPPGWMMVFCWGTGKEGL